MKRDYGQMCGLASSMTVLGERWSLLIIRELLVGPMRFRQLEEALAGIGPNLLSLRLNYLREMGVIEQVRVDSDARGKAYALTEMGEELRGPVLQLAKWGLRFIRPEDHGVVRGEWAFIALQAMVYGSEIPPVSETYHFEVGDAETSIVVDEGKVDFRQGPAQGNPAVRIVSDPETFILIGARALSPLSAIVSGRVQVSGDEGAIERCIDLLGLAAA